MGVFKLYKDCKVSVWQRYQYEVEADSLKEAVQQILSDAEDAHDFEELYDTETLMEPRDNNYEPTIEIYEKDSDKFLWGNSGI